MAESKGLSARMSSNIDAILPKIAATIAERTSTGHAKIDLATAENWLLRPELLALCKAAISRHLTTDQFSYPLGFGGDPALLNAIASFFNTYFHPAIPVLPHQIVTTAGASSCLDSLLYNICDPGDSVLVPGPYWNGFDFHFRIRANVNIIVVNLPTFSQTFTSALLPTLASAFSSAPNPHRIKALVLTNPHNPFGQCYPTDVLLECVRFCCARAIHFVSDEVYAMSEFASSAEPVIPFISVLALDISGLLGGEEEINRSRVHVVWSISKDFGSSGIRMGCIVSQANQPLLTGVALASSTQVSSLSSVFVTALLTSPELPRLVALNTKRLAESYQIVAGVLRQWNVEFIPASAGLFVFAKLAKGIKTWEEEETVMERLKESGVLVGSGRAFHVVEGEKGWMRVTFALPEEVLREGLKKLQSCLQLG